MASASHTASELPLLGLLEMDDMMTRPEDLDQIFHKMLTMESIVANIAKMYGELVRYDINTEAAAEIENQIGESDFVPKVVTFTAVIDHYANAGRTNDAFKVFFLMLANDVTPNHCIFTLIIKALAACAPANANFRHFVGFAMKYFVEMLDKGLQPTPGTYVALFEKIDKARDREEFVGLIKGKGFMPPPDELHTAVKDHEIPYTTKGAAEAAIHQRKVFENATKDTSDKEMKKTFEKMDKNWIMEEAMRMYDGLIRDRQGDLANKIFENTKMIGILPDVAIHTVVIEAYANARKAVGALKAYKHMLANEVEPNSNTYSVLIKALAADRDFISDAREYFLEMLDKGMIPNSDTCEAVSKEKDSNGKDGEYMEFAEAVITKGLNIFKTKDSKENDTLDLQAILLMLECGIPIKAKSYNMIIKWLAFVKPGPSAVKYAKKYFLEMLEKGMQLESVTYTLVMEAIGCQSDSKAKVMEEAREFLGQIKDKGLVLDNLNFFEFHKHLEEAINTFRMYEYATRTNDEEMQQIFLKWRTNRDDVMKYGIDMFRGLVDDGYKNEATELFEPIFETGIHPHIVMHTAIIQAYVAAGKIKGAFEAYFLMIASGITPNSYAYSVIIKALSTDPNFFRFAKKYLLDMMDKSMWPNAATYTTVFEGFARQGKKGVEEGRGFLNAMKGKGFELDEDAVSEVLKGRKGKVVEGIMDILFDKSHLPSVSALANRLQNFM